VKQLLENILAVLDQKERKRFGFLTLLDIFISIVDISSIALLLWIIQFYIQPTNSSVASFLPAWFSNNSLIPIAVFVFLFGTKNWIGYLISKAQYKFISRIAVRISRNNLSNYQQARFSEFIYTDSSAHIRNIAFQPFEFSQYLLSGAQQIITQLSLILVTIIAIILFNAKLFLLLLLVLVPPVLIVSYLIKKKLAKAKKNIQESNQLSFQYLLDSLKGYVESNIYNRNDFFLKRFIGARQKFSSNLFDSLTLQTMPSRIIEVFAVLGLFVLIVLAKSTNNNDQATFITIGAFMAAAYRIIPGIVKIINTAAQVRSYELALQSLREQNPTTEQTVSKNLPAKQIESVAFRKVNFKYEEQQILKDISFSISKGDFVGITGASGKGKTTILNLMLGFLPLNGSGEILLNNAVANGANLHASWPAVAYVRQQKFLIHDSLLKNITLQEDGFNKENLGYALRVAGLEELVASFPEGIEKVITENGKNISGGQQQRIALARALYKKDSSLIILDEPFNELDEVSTKTLLEHFRTISQEGKIVVMISHDRNSLSYCNKIISLDQ